MPTDRPILFSAPMVRAILDGKKSETRRVVKPQPRPDLYYGYLPWPNDESCITWDDVLADTEYYVKCGHCPFQVGMDLWVRETWGFSAKLPASTKDELSWLAYPELRAYRADNPEGNWCWRPSIHMPRWASRLTLEITQVRVQRVQEISDEDAMAEGVTPDPSRLDPYSVWPAPISHHSAFRELWDSINGGRGYSWESNPYVWCVSFRVVTRQEDE